jgi:glycopeptide antibiotics resistance protein
MKTYQKILIGYLAAIILGTIVPFIAFLCILSYSFITWNFSPLTHFWDWTLARIILVIILSTGPFFGIAFNKE